MCGLFGVYFYDKPVTNFRELVKKLAYASTVRGTDATGLAWVKDGKMNIVKDGKSAYLYNGYSKIPEDVNVVLGHTRRTTKGDAKFNQNNHPFVGNANVKFAFAHNGVIDNDLELRKEFDLPDTNIVTDSYVCVQLLEKKGKLDFETVKWMAETVEGMFTFTILDCRNNLYIVKNDSPFILAHFKSLGMYAWASTEEILFKALVEFSDTRAKIVNAFRKGDISEVEVIEPKPGQILRIDLSGNITWATFQPRERVTKNSRLYAIANANAYGGWGDLFGYYEWDWNKTTKKQSKKKKKKAKITVTYEEEVNTTYYEEVVEFAKNYGVTKEDIDDMLEYGYTLEEIENGLSNGTVWDMLEDAYTCLYGRRGHFNSTGVNYSRLDEKEIEDLPFVIKKK